MRNNSIQQIKSLYEINENINQLQDELFQAKSGISGQKIMLNSNDGNWIEGNLENSHYNALGKNKEEIKFQIKLKDSYYDKSEMYNFFNCDLWGYITLSQILEWQEKYQSGEEAEFLFKDKIYIGATGYIYKENKPYKCEISEIIRIKDNKIKLKVTYEMNEKMSLVKFKKQKTETISIIEYLADQTKYRREN